MTWLEFWSWFFLSVCVAAIPWLRKYQQDEKIRLILERFHSTIEASGENDHS
jgi:hypothetical protein